MSATTPLQEEPAPSATMRGIMDIVETNGFAITVIVCLAIAVYLRLWLLGYSGLNSDEATVGLNARQILHGHFSTFFWGQTYGGVEPYVVAVLFLVFGSSTFVLNGTPAFLAVLAALVVWRIGRRLFTPAAALVAATLSFIWPDADVWNSTREYGFHEVGLLLGLLVVWMAIRIVQGARTGGNDLVRDWVLFGLLVGLAWWATPETTYFTVPSVVVVALSLRAHDALAIVKRVAVCLGTGIVGAFPWILASLRDGFATLTTGLPSAPVSYSTRLSIFFTHVFPMLMGLRIRGAGQWEGSPGLAAFLLVLICGVLLAAMFVVAIRVPDARLLVGILALYPFLYAAFPTASFWNDGRYGIGLAPIAALVAVGALWQIAPRGTARWVSIGILSAALLSTVIAEDVGAGGLSKVASLTGWRANSVPTVTLLSHRLQALGIRDVYAGYWIAYDLAFLSGGSIAVNPLVFDRDQADSHEVANARNVAWVFVPPKEVSMLADQVQSSDLNPDELTEAIVASRLKAQRIPFRTERVGPFQLILVSTQHFPRETEISVTGSRPTATVTLIIDGQQTQYPNASLPFSYRLPQAEDFDWISVTAQSLDASADTKTTCSVLGRSGTLTTNTSVGTGAVSCLEDLQAYTG